MSAVPLRLSRLSRADAECCNRLARPRRPLPLPGNESFSLHLLEEPDQNGMPGGERLQIGFALGPDNFSGTMPRPLLLDLVRSLDGELRLDPLPPPDLLALLLEAALMPLVDALERGTGGSVRLDAVAEPTRGRADGAPDDPPATARIALQGPGLHQVLTVAATRHALDRLLRAWPTDRRPMDRLPVRGRLEAGTTILPLRLVRSLRPGDAVLLQDDLTELVRGPALAAHASALRLVVSDSVSAVVRAAGPQWRLAAPLRPIARAGQTVHENGSPDTGASSTRLEQAELDGIPVRLVFEAGAVELSLGQLRELGAGSVIEMDARPGTVRILANGRRIGDGELVEVDGRAGVRITAFVSDIDGPGDTGSGRGA